MRYKFIDFEMGSVIKKVCAIVSAFIITFGIGNAIENAGGTYAASMDCPSGYSVSENDSNYCCPSSHEYDYSAQGNGVGNSAVYDKCIREVESSVNCNSSEKYYSFGNSTGSGNGGWCYIDAVPVTTFSCYQCNSDPGSRAWTSGTPDSSYSCPGNAGWHEIGDISSAYFCTSRWINYSFSGGTMQISVGSNVSDNYTVYAASNTTITLPYVSKTGYSFSHWKDSSGNTYEGGKTITITKDLNLTAVWEQKSCYYCAYNSTTEWVSSSPSTSCPSTWSKQSGITTQSNCAVRTITYDLDGGDMSQSTTYKNVHGGSVTLPTPNKSGYGFKNWKKSSGTTTYAGGQTITLTGDLALTAVWEKTNTYSVTFDYNGGKSSNGYSSYKKTVNENETVDAPSGDFAPTREGYNFVYWELVNMGSSVSHEEYDFDTPVTSNLTLYAKWELKESGGSNNPPTGTAATLEATFNRNGGSWSDGSSTSTKKETCTTEVGETSCIISSLPSVTKEGYTFNGWGSNANCTSGSTSSLNINSSATNYYYACFTENSSATNPPEGEGTVVTATFNGNGGTISGGTRKSCTIESGETSCDIVSLPTATKKNSTFTGWSLSKNCTTSTNKITLSRNTTYYACYKDNNSSSQTPGTDNPEVDENPNTGSFLLYVVYLLGILSLGYTGYYIYKVVKLKK